MVALKTTEIFSINTSTSTSGTDMPQLCFNHSGVLWEKKGLLYFVGGMNGQAASMKKWTFVYDISSGTYSTLANQMSTARVNHACTILTEKEVLIAAGGFTQLWRDTETVEILNLNSGSWSQADSMPFSGGQVWAFDGHTFTWKYQKMYQYIPVQNQWVEIEDVPLDLDGVLQVFIPVQEDLGTFCPFI